MAPAPLDVTFQPGEREALEGTFRARSPSVSASPSTSTSPLAAASLPPPAARTGSRRILKEHTCPVTYPDGDSGFCHYERKAPALHRLRFTDSDGKALASLWHTQALAPGVIGIEDTAAKLTTTAFADAIERERKEYFARASEGPERVKHPDRFQMTAARAKEIGGHYALCIPIGDKGERLLPLTSTFDTLEAANAAWRERGDVLLVVACGNRLDRCWERPRYNPLYAECPEMRAHTVHPVSDTDAHPPAE